MAEVCRAHSTKRRPFERNLKLKPPVGKERIQQKFLSPQYVVGFVDGEGSFSVSINKHATLRRKVEVKPEFEVELRADDREILERLAVTIGCGTIYDCSYERYGWFPHVKYKVTSTRQIAEFVIPFFDRYPPQAKKRHVYALFRAIVMMVRNKEHLTARGLRKIRQLRERMRKFGRKSRQR